VTIRKTASSSDWSRSGKAVSRGAEVERRMLPIPLERIGRPRPEVPLDLILQSVERALIRQSLEHAATVRGAARVLGLSTEALAAKMRRLGISAPRPVPRGASDATVSRPVS
jgi:transcriptional regulator with GAF, ATPase, and Fis domain